MKKLGWTAEAGPRKIFQAYLVEIGEPMPDRADSWPYDRRIDNAAHFILQVVSLDVEDGNAYKGMGEICEGSPRVCAIIEDALDKGDPQLGEICP